MGGNAHDENLEKPAVPVEVPAQPQPAVKRDVELLVCKCLDCTHWEIVKDVDQLSILCKTCGLEVPIRFDFDDHEKLHWQKHER